MRYEVSKALFHLSKEELQQLAQVGCVQLGWWNLIYGGDQALCLSQYADGFYRAARDLLNAFCDKIGYSDAEALPIFFLIFHFIELSLKAAIEAKLQLLEISGTPPQTPPRDHKIRELLTFLGSLFETDEWFLSQETQEFILKMAELNGRSAQVFRYPFDMKNTIHLEDRPVFSMGILRAEFEIHGEELSAFRDWTVHHLVG